VDSEITVEQDGNDVVVGRHATNSIPPGMFVPFWPNHPARVDKFTNMRWMAPSTLRLLSGISKMGAPPDTGTGYHAIHMLTPMSERSTHYFFTAVRWGILTNDEAIDRDLQERIAKMRRFAFEEQDAPVIEAQQRIIESAERPLEPVILAIDVGPVRYKRILNKMIDAEQG
jgi:vanillate O-demethylase monooxygenase subunit